MSQIVARTSYLRQFEEIVNEKKSAFIAITGRRRIGKTFLVDHAFGNMICFRVTGVMNGDFATQLNNFVLKLAEYSNTPFLVKPNNWQDAFAMFKAYLKTLPKTKKQVIFFDELPWMNTHKSNFIQLFAHLWNDYLSKENHFVLIICGSATSWMYKNIQNDKGGFHNRITHHCHLEAFTLTESKEFLTSKGIKLTNTAIAELYMTLGGVPYYLDKIRKGESVNVAIDRLFFGTDAPLRHEYDNLYKSLFENADNHEAIVKALATSRQGLSREELIRLSGVQDGGPIQRSLEDLLSCGFITSEAPLGKQKRGSLFRLNDEYSCFYHRFLRGKKITGKGSWINFAQSQSYRIWAGYAFENLCKKHIEQIKAALGIKGVYTQTSSFRYEGDGHTEGFQIDLLIDRNDKTINLCECKYHSKPLIIDKNYAQKLAVRKALFISSAKTSKTVFTTLITNLPIVENAYSLDVADARITVDDFFA